MLSSLCKSARRSALILLLSAIILPSAPRAENRLVILHTNDTHSQIDPDASGLGGVARRKVLIDSIKAANPEVLLVDAGDAVQGTLYFTLFGGKVEQKVLNDLAYDIQILGNHEFDNGMEALAGNYKNARPTILSSNYRLDDSALDGMFKPYLIRRVGGKKVGIIAINLIPEGMIADKNSIGVKYLDGIKAANAYAWILKNMEGCDMVVAISHIGYEHEPGCADVDIATNSSDIDVIIGGHSHTLIDPQATQSKPWRVANLRGDSVLIAQTGKSGKYLGEIILDLDSLTAVSRVIRVDSRLDSRLDPAFVASLAPYKAKVDSVMNIRIGNAPATFEAESSLLNLISDVVFTLGEKFSGKRPDLAIMNKGGLRANLLRGPVTKGDIMQIMPFDNRVVVLEISGRDLLDALKVMGARGGDGVSSGVRAIYDIADGSIVSATIDGKPIDPSRTYTLATIDYLAGGGDYMIPLKNGRRIAESSDVIYDNIIDEFTHGSLHNKKLRPDSTRRMTPAK